MRLSMQIAAWACLVMAATSAGARELQVSLETRVQGESNILRRTTEPLGDAFVLISPRARVTDTAGRLTYDWFYRPSYESYFRNPSLNRWNHVLGGNSAYSFSPNDQVSLNLTAFDRRYRQRLPEEGGAGVSGDQPDISDRVKSIQARATYSRRFDARLVGRASGDFQMYFYDGVNSADNRSLGGELSLDYGYTLHDRMGGGLAATQQVFAATLGRPESTTTVGRVFVLLEHEFSPTTKISARVGPTLLLTEEASPPAGEVFVPQFPLGVFAGTPVVAHFDGCGSINGFPVFSRCVIDGNSPGIAPGMDPLAPKGVRYLSGQDPSRQSSRLLTYFASISLSKEWSRVTGVLSYDRRASASSVGGASTLLDSASLEITWRPESDWTFGVIGRWYQRQSISKQTQTLIAVERNTTITPPNGGPDYAESSGLISVTLETPIDFAYYSGSFWATYRVDKRLNLSGYFRYEEQVSRGRGFNNFNNYVGYLRLTYDFDAFFF